ncbi:MAG: hypothetical protein A3A44_01540 [Candidatus Sungbacteria bacterium RIFCSPLOWO2_01_FULL_60_25]|uniref:DUF3137 domain-containing protein n=1 Tax=Candidatus Sungbacteria bacterium RIFCSPLOWO2_01_FULL_60_25 TaxID=1802281 RepID=A0A1G2LGN6_9BACT|nr:MAG: hypothetical protein A3A44_01540 [Candidatus Sungbacteria bacterium RIFCSPLOWO2_01_FULL_60_25]
MQDESDFDIIDAVGVGTYAYLRDRWGLKFYAPLFVLAIGGAFEAWANGSGILLTCAAVWSFGVIALANARVRKEFMRQFAAANQFVYQGSGNVAELSGALFQRGHSRSVNDMVVGQRDGRPLRFFFYRYKVGSGRSEQTYSYTVCEIALPGAGPDVVVESRRDFDFSNYAREGGREVPTESPFREHFRLTAPKDFEIEVLEIFTPEVMAWLMDRAEKYNFEFIRGRLYIFQKGHMSRREQLKELLGIAEYLVTVIAPRILRIQDDVAALHQAFGRTPTGEAA